MKGEAPTSLLEIPLEGLQVAEVAPLLRRAYREGQCIIADLIRDHTGVYLRAASIDRKTWEKVRKLVNGALNAKP